MSVGKTLAYTLVVRHPDTGAPVALVSGSAVPDWAAELVHDDDLVSTGSPAKDDKAKAPTKGKARPARA